MFLSKSEIDSGFGFSMNHFRLNEVSLIDNGSLLALHRVLLIKERLVIRAETLSYASSPNCMSQDILINFKFTKLKSFQSEIHFNWIETISAFVCVLHMQLNCNRVVSN